jgi:hypothetical protein
MRLFTLYVLEFFQVASAIKLHKKSICAFCPTAISPTLPYVITFLYILFQESTTLGLVDRVFAGWFND